MKWWETRLFPCLTILCFFPQFTLQRYDYSSYCPCATLEAGKKQEAYVEEEAFASTFHELLCCPRRLLPTSEPPYNISWTFKGQPSPWTREISTFFRSPCGLETLETDAPLPSDAGNYTCTVIDANGMHVSRTINLCFNVNKNFEAPAPSKAPKDVMTLPGESTDFYCEAYVGRPRCLRPVRHNFSWTATEENGSVTQVENLPNVMVSHGNNMKGMVWSKLIIEEVIPAHFAEYSCRINNAYGELVMNATLKKGIPAKWIPATIYKTILVVLMTMVSFMTISLYLLPRLRMAMVLYHRDKTSSISGSDDYKHDVVVVHGETTAEWVWSYLIPGLENDYGYSCFLPQRDLFAGELLIESIAEAVSQSCRVLVVVSPCLLECPWAAWAIHNGFQATLSTNKVCKMIAVVIENIKNTPTDEDSTGIMKILSRLHKISVPAICRSGYTGEVVGEEGQEPLTFQPKRERPRELSLPTLKLKIPDSKKSKVRSRSKSPNGHRIANMITSTNTVSRNGCSNGDGTDKKTKKNKKGNKQKRRSIVFTDDREEEDSQDLGTPCSLTPFIFPSRQNSKDCKINSKFQPWMSFLKLLCTRDQEQLFWQSLRLHLAPATRHHSRKQTLQVHDC